MKLARDQLYGDTRVRGRVDPRQTRENKSSIFKESKQKDVHQSERESECFCDEENKAQKGFGWDLDLQAPCAWPWTLFFLISPFLLSHDYTATVYLSGSSSCCSNTFPSHRSLDGDQSLRSADWDLICLPLLFWQM